jgi:hypothetical protein
MPACMGRDEIPRYTEDCHGHGWMAGVGSSRESRMMEQRREAVMDQELIDRIARILYRISDSQERDEVTREIAQIFAEAQSDFDTQRFYQRANVAYLENR